jgi:hypothetical protein
MWVDSCNGKTIPKDLLPMRHAQIGPTTSCVFNISASYSTSQLRIQHLCYVFNISATYSTSLLRIQHLCCTFNISAVYSTSMLRIQHLCCRIALRNIYWATLKPRVYTQKKGEGRVTLLAMESAKVLPNFLSGLGHTSWRMQPAKRQSCGKQKPLLLLEGHNKWTKERKRHRTVQVSRNLRTQVSRTTTASRLLQRLQRRNLPQNAQAQIAIQAVLSTGGTIVVSEPK